MIYDMFHLESHIISEMYGGEKFGRGIYYRLVYGTDQEEEKCEIFLVFETEQLQVSLLLDTGKGYFSYCTLTPHLLKKGSATPINIDNAMIEVEEYLKKIEEPTKPKVLLVDDSIAIRQMIKNLLDEHYDVSLASSGTAAIRCLVLDRPDLVLLDYEMPICDGKQVLEMIPCV